MAPNKSRYLRNLTATSLLTYMHPQAPMASQYRVIRNNIDHIAANSPLRSLAITSPGQQEGKTTATVNLAISKTQRGDKVLIIDANMKNPVIHHIFNTKLSPGLTNVLAGQLALKEAVTLTGIGSMAILPFGTMLYNSVEMLDSMAMSELIRLAKQDYDWIILDTAPVLDVLDTNSLARKCDGVILVLNNGKTQRDAALKAKRSLEFSAKANIIGVIHNHRHRS